MVSRKEDLHTSAFGYLQTSGIAELILSSPSGADIPYRKIPLEEDTKVRNQHYFRFVQDHITVVLGLADDGASRGHVRLNSKSIQMDESAVEHFKRGWGALTQMYGEEASKHSS